MAYDTGTMGTNWRGRDRAQILNDRYARQNARTAAQQPVAVTVPESPQQVPGLPPVTQPAPPGTSPWVPWNPYAASGGLSGYAHDSGLHYAAAPGGDGRPSYIPADYDPFHQTRDLQQWDMDPWSIAQRTAQMTPEQQAEWKAQEARQRATDEAAYAASRARYPDGNLSAPQQGDVMPAMEELMRLLGGGQMGGAQGVMPGEHSSRQTLDLSGLGQAPPGGGYGGPSGIGGGGIDDPIQMYLSTVPVMDNMMKNRVSGAMGQAGLSGGRFSSGAQNTAARIGGETSLQQNQMLNELLYNHTQQDLNRGLESSIASLGFGSQDLDRQLAAATAQGQLGLGMDASQQNRDNMLGQYGMWEQGRQDDFSKMRYEDFINSRMGFLPMIFQFLGGMGGAPGQAQGYQINQGGGQTGLMDILPLLISMFK